MKKRNKRFLQKFLSGFLSLAIVLSGISLPQMSVRAEEPDGTDYIVGGDFTGLDWNSGKLGEWTFSDWDAVKEAKLDQWADRNDTSSGTETGLAITFKDELEEEGIFEIYQTISALPAGIYKLTAYVKSAVEAKGFDGDSYSKGDMNYTEAVDATSDWMELTHNFTVKSNVTDYVVGVSITAGAGAWICLDDVSLICVEAGSEGYTLEELKALYEEAKVLIEGRESSDFKEGFAELQTALEKAKELIDADSEDDSDAINSAYEALAAAKAALKLADLTVNFYFYSETEDEIGLVFWANGGITTTAETIEDWQVWGGSPYRVSAVDGYKNWYTIELTFEEQGSSENGGFELFTKADTNNSFYVCSKNYDNHSEVYAALISGQATDYAVKDDVVYAGDMAENARNQVTLYVYDESATPLIAVINGTLSNLKDTESTEELETYDAGVDWGTWYEMTAVSDQEYWYELTFIMPAADGNGEFFELYSGSSSNWVTNFKTEGGDYAVDGTQLLSGNCCYKDGVFYSSIEDADGVTLKKLRDYVNGEVIADIVTAGAESYTEETWTVFAEAKAAAEKVLADAESEGLEDDATSKDIENAYKNLVAAVAELKKPGQTITLYYYAANREKLGINLWNGSGQYLTTSAEPADWYVWNSGDIYAMTPVEGYAGWFSISLTYQEATDSADPGFSIFYDNKDTAKIEEISYKWDGKDIYAEITNGEYSCYAVKSGKVYGGTEADMVDYMRNITLHVYGGETVPNLQLKGTLEKIDADTNQKAALTADSTDEWGNLRYNMTADAAGDGWYELTFIVPQGDTSAKLMDLYLGDTWEKNLVNGPTDEWGVDITPVFSGLTYYKDGVLYSSKEAKVENSFTKLKDQLAAQVALVKTLDEANYKEEGWKTLQTALQEAEELLEQYADEEEGDEEAAADLQDAYDKLVEAFNALVPAREAAVSVQQVALAEDFITGADLSSYIALKESGVVFKDQNGNALSDKEFFEMLAKGGTNWVRIRIWNDPYDSNGNGYGGGNCDVEKAVKLGKLATDAGMRVLIDFHYSDFWADPSKQQAPKAWSSYTIEQKEEAVYNFTLESLNTLRDAGVDVGMVQVGNETNTGVCGETSTANMCRIFSAGSKAVRAFDKDCLVAVHFTDPQNNSKFTGFASMLSGVDYDVFAASFYPYWHGDTENLTEVLKKIAEDYGKKVMVAETSWATTWEDGDGHGNTAPKTLGQRLDYDISVQGQADEIRDVVNAVNLVNETQSGKGIGVFYWEPAWLSANYAINADGSVNQSAYKQNQALWEKYGAGWASSYSYEYDPSDAGLWYGGSAIDNQAWFDFDGTALPTAEIYSLIRTGATAPLTISQLDSQLVLELVVGEEVSYPETVTAYFNNGTSTDYPVVWDKDEMKLVNTDKAGIYTVTGNVNCTYDSESGGTVTTKTEKYKVSLEIRVLFTSNILPNPGFENGMTNWTISYADGDSSGYSVGNTVENPRSGDYGMNFWRDDVMQFEVLQKVEGLAPGMYTFGGYIQGGSVGPDDLQYAFVRVHKTDGSIAHYKAETSVSGWQNWSNPEIKGIAVESGDWLEVGFEINSTVAGGWGSVDDCYLYGSYNLTVNENIKNGKLTVSNLEPTSGEVVKLTAQPNAGYTLTKITVSGDAVTNETAKTLLDDGAVSSYDADTHTAILTYTEQGDMTTAVFTMPDGFVTVSAEFEKFFGDTPIDLDSEDVKIAVIPDQFYTGKAVKPALKVTYKGYTLTSADYSVSYSDNVNISPVDKPAKVVLKGKGKFTGSTMRIFFIREDSRTDISKATVELQNYDDAQKKAYYYTGYEITPEVKVKIGETEVPSSDYDVYYENNKKLGSSAKIVVVAKSESEKYRGSVNGKFTIAKCPVTVLTISNPAGSTYTGKAVKPTVIVKQGSNVLQLGKDYTVSYSGNTQVSKQDASGNPNTYLVVKGKGNYIGTSEKKYFTVKAKSIADVSVEASVQSLVEKNSAQTVKAVVKDGTKTLSSSNYQIAKVEKVEELENGTIVRTTMESNKVTEKGTYEATIEGRNNYTGSREVTFKVLDKEHLIPYATVKTTAQVYTGAAIKLTTTGENPGLTVKPAGGKDVTPLIEGTDYTVTYEKNIKVGTATALITGIGNYAGTKKVTFRITKRKMEAESIKYEIVPDDIYGTDQYYTGYKLEPALKVTAVNDGKTVSLKKGADYKVVYSNNVKPGSEATIKIQGIGNYSGSVTFKNAFTVLDRTLDDLVVTINPVSYTGKAIKPAISFVDKKTGVSINMKQGTAYTISYKNNTKVAGKENTNQPYVIIKEKGMRQEGEKKTITPSFTITTAIITEADVKDIQMQTYSGKAVTPSVSITVNGRKLTKGKDYVLTLTDNNGKGLATAQITGVGNYAGTVKKTFIIK